MLEDEKITAAFDGYILGAMGETTESRRAGVAVAIFKNFCGYSCSLTMLGILTELGVTKSLFAYPIKKARKWAFDCLLGSQTKTCAWEEGFDGSFGTSCDFFWSCNYPTPGEQGMKFCPYCGKLLHEALFKKVTDV